jgi:hypothetical protein
MANPEHLAKLKEGVEAWNKWRKENPDIEPDLKEAHLHEARLEHANLAGAHLENANLMEARLENADLSGAHLENAILIEAHLENAHLREAHLENAILSGASLENANLMETHLENALLRGADFTDANVTRLSYVGPASVSEKRTQLWDWLGNPIPYRKRVIRGRYQGIRGLSSCYGNRIFVRDASDQDYLDTIEEQLHTWWGRFAFWLWGLTDYGRSFMSVVVFASMLIFVFGLVYSRSPGMITADGRCPTPFTPYYFSIVTYTTLGFGDVKPHNLAGEILVSIEVILGYITLGLLLAVLGDKVARRS